jgi:SHS2 domain-containing protein
MEAGIALLGTVPMSPVAWEHFHHDADIGVRGRGNTLAQAFEQAALALTAVITDPRRVRPEIEVRIELEAPDTEYLLYQWLNELVFQMVTRRLLFGRFEVQVTGTRLEARAWGEPVDRARHRPAVEVKGATLTALSVHSEPGGGWVAQCVVDV